MVKAEAPDKLQIVDEDRCACVCGCEKVPDSGHVMCPRCRKGAEKSPEGRHGVK